MREAPNQILRGPIVRSLFTLAWPMMASNLLMTMYNVIDAFWLGKLGKEALAAPTLAWPVIFLVISLGIGLGIAGTALVAQYTGAGKQEEAERVAGNAFSFLLGIGLLLSAGGYLATEPILRLMGAEPEVLRLARSYMQIVFASLPTIFVLFTFRALLQGWGDTLTPMKLFLWSVGLNMVLDPLLIFGLGPFPRWEVSGAATATALSRGALAIYGVYLLFSGRVGITLRPAHLRPDWGIVGRLLRIGVPNSVGMSGTALGFSVLMGIVARFGTATIGAFGVGNRVISLVMMPAMGLGQATTTAVGQNLGSDQKRRAEQAAWASTGINAALLAAMGAFSFLFRADLIRIFIDDPAVIQRGAELFRLVSFSLPFVGILQVMIGTYQGSGHTVYSMLFSLVRLWVLRLPLAYLLGGLMGSDGVWWAMSLSNLGAASLSLGLFLTGNWKEKVIERRAAMAPVADPGEEA